MIQVLKKAFSNLTYTFNEVKKINSSLPVYRIASIETKKNCSFIFEIQIVGKNITLHYSLDDLLHDPSITFIYENMSETEKAKIEQYQSLSKNKITVTDNLKLIKFKKYHIKSINLEPSTHKLSFSISIPLDKGEKIINLPAGIIIKKPEIFHQLNVNDKIQIAYYAGMEEILDEQESLNSRKKAIPFLKKVLNIFIKK